MQQQRIISQQQAMIAQQQQQAQAQAQHSVMNLQQQQHLQQQQLQQQQQQHMQQAQMQAQQIQQAQAAHAQHAQQQQQAHAQAAHAQAQAQQQQQQQQQAQQQSQAQPNSQQPTPQQQQAALQNMQQAQQQQAQQQQAQQQAQAQAQAQQQAVQQQQQQQAAQQQQQQQQNQANQQQQPTPQQTPQPNQSTPQAQSAPNAQQQHQQQQMALAAAHAQQQALMRPQQKIGTAVLKLLQFCEHLSASEGNKRDLNHWRKFVNDFYSHSGVMRHNLWNSGGKETKRFEITTPVLARYYHSLYENGIKNIQLVMENAREREINGSSHVESQRASFIFWFENGTHIVAQGTLRASLNMASQIDILEFDTSEHTEYVPRRILENAKRASTSSPDQKASPRVNSKAVGKRQQMQQLPPPPPPISIPDSPIGAWGVPDQVVKLLELAETLSSMRDLFGFSQQNPSLDPKQVLQAYVQQLQNQQIAHQQSIAHAQQQHAQQMLQQQQQQQHAQQQQMLAMGTPHMQNSVPPGMQGSPAMPNSPHLSQNGIPGATPSPAQSHLQAPGMVAQHSQQHHGANGANGATPTNPSASPNVTNKRRRASTAGVKTEAPDDGDVPVPPPAKVKQSPRTGNASKRQKQAS
ncbi:hypothetical protein ABW20_dc0107094 [Dactylellina cionopaga]|nr:hypothetical protein ABW20_dc0107094 [Dactylellina cionopaga]